MAYNCWSFSAGGSPSCNYPGLKTWSIDNTVNNPLLPVPDYIIKQLGPVCLDFQWQIDNYNEEARKNWTTFCDPPRATYPITNIGNWPTTPTPYQTDISRGPSTATLPDYYLNRGFAIACRIIPTSKCLPYIVFHNAYNQAVGTNTIVEIRKDDNGLPMGTPGDMNIYGKVSAAFPTDIYNYAVPVNAILDEIDVPVWVVLYSTDYACSNAFTEARLKLKKSDVTADNNIALFSEGTGCTWAIDNTVKSISLASYKSISCSGTVVINDFAFAQILQPPTSPIYLDSNCFIRLQDIQGSKVALGVIYTNPDLVRVWRRVRFSFAYLKPDLRYFTGTADIFNVTPGQHETFFEMDDFYFPGKYDQLSVSAVVVQV